MAMSDSSGISKWLLQMVHRKINSSFQQQKNEEIKQKILACQKETNGIFGYPRVTVWLRKKHHLQVNHKRVYRLMKELGIQARIRKKKHYYGKKEIYVVSDNHLNREFQAERQMKNG